MATRKGKEILSGLLKKGFTTTQSDHTKLILYIKGKKTNIFTKVSHGNKEYGDKLLNAVKRQVKLQNKQDLLNLIDCPMSREEYLNYLAKNDIINISCK